MKALALSFLIVHLAGVALAQQLSLGEILSKLDSKPTPSLARNAATTAILERQSQMAFIRMVNCFVTLLGDAKKEKLPQDRLPVLTSLADSLMLLGLVNNSGECDALSDVVFCKWLFKNQGRLDSFLDNFNPQFDDFPGTMEILRTLYQHDPESREKTWPLMLALALVWDKSLAPLHNQIGENAIEFSPDIARRFDFFKSTLCGPHAVFSMETLSIPSLCLIVDTPVPVSELLWAQRNVKERSPEKIYKSIKYDSMRVNSLAFSWPYGRYSLEAIQNKGGICVDQAYYTVIVLRSRGIPALLFSGKGLRGRHAWVAYLKNKQTWETGVGRYNDQKFTTGEARNPQTGETFIDHLLPIVSENFIRKNSISRDSDSLARLAFALLFIKRPKLAEDAAYRAVSVNKYEMSAWQILEHAQENPDGLIRVLDEQAKAFAKYSDVVTKIRLRQVALLRQNGRDAESEALLKKLMNNNRKREDLSREIAFQQIEMALAEKNPEKARLLFEKHLRSQKKEGAKVLEDLYIYLDFTKEINQTAPAEEFTEYFVKTFKRSFNKISRENPVFQNWDREVLSIAYENNHNYKKLKKLK